MLAQQMMLLLPEDDIYNSSPLCEGRLSHNCFMLGFVYEKGIDYIGVSVAFSLS